jgi:hypothetical protein
MCVGIRAAVGPRSRFFPGGQTMMRHIALLLSLAVCLGGCGQTQAIREERAVNAILKLGGRVARDEGLPGQPVTHINLSRTEVMDSDMKDLRELKDLQWLDLSGTKTTDAGLNELKELKGLLHLDLSDTQITDTGLKDLKELRRYCKTMVRMNPSRRVFCDRSESPPTD